MSDSTYLSTRDLAIRLTPGGPADDVAKAVRQVQHWTELDHLSTVGAKNIGTGRSRLYERNELYKALILQELVRVGVRVAELEGFGSFLDHAIQARSKQWNAACEGTGSAFLEAYFGPDGATAWNITGEVPDLRLLTKSVAKSSGMSRDFTTCTVLNLTRLFKGKIA